MLSVTIVCLKILTRTFRNYLSYEEVLITARGKELNNLQKPLIVKLWKDEERYRNISSNQNISFIMITSFIAMFKRCNTVEKKTKKKGDPRKVSPRLSRKSGHLINKNPMVTHEELQEDLHSSGHSLTK